MRVILSPLSIAFFFAFSLLSLEQKGQKCQHQSHFFKENYNSRSDSIDLLHQSIFLDFTEFSTNFIRAHSQITALPLLSNLNEIHFDLEGLIVDSVFINSYPTLYSQGISDLHLDLPNYALGDTLLCQIYYHGNPIHDTSWGGFYFQSGYAYNMGVGFDALPHNYGRVWHPCYDSFRERSTYELHVKTNGNRTAYCGGLRISTDFLGGDTLVSHWSLNRPIPSYLASVAVSTYTHSSSNFQSISGTTIPIWLASKAVDSTDMQASFIHLPNALESFEANYGPYQWPRVGFTAVPFSGGAMEHATNIAYPLFAINGNTQYETLMAHELSHHWWGDLITCERAEEMWINEGMASYSERIFTEYLYGYSAYSQSIRDNHRDVLLNAARNDGGYFPLSDVPENVTYGSTVYNKGADFAHTLRGIMGDANFFNATKDLMESFAFSTVNTSQLRDFFQSYTTEDLNAVFDLWVFQPGYPDFRVGYWSAISNNSTYQMNLQIEQYLHHATAFGNNIPVEIEVQGINGEIFNDRLMFTNLSGDDYAVFTIDLPFQPKHVFINRNDRMHYACLAEEQTVNSVGSHDLTFANTEFDILSIAQTDSVWIRSEMHLTAADRFTYLPSTEYVISPDRSWYIHTNSIEGVETKTTFRFSGSAAATNALDTALFAEMELLGLDETHLVLLHRKGSNEAWEEVTEAVLFTSGSATNWNGRFEVPNIESGYYAFGIKTGFVQLNENSLNSLNFQVFPNRIETKENRGVLRIINVSGQIVYEEYISTQKSISTAQFSSGKYIIQMNQQTANWFKP